MVSLRSRRSTVKFSLRNIQTVAQRTHDDFIEPHRWFDDLDLDLVAGALRGRLCYQQHVGEQETVDVSLEINK